MLQFGEEKETFLKIFATENSTELKDKNIIIKQARL